MSSFAINVLLLVLATIAYTIYLFQKHGEHAWDGIPGPLRWVYLPCYIIVCVYITGLVLQWGLIVPGLIQWVLNITLYLLDWKLISLINQIISDLMYTPVLAMIVFFPCIMPHFKSDARFTYIFRMITLACLVATHIYTINFFDMGDAVEGLDMFIYDLELAVAAYLTYSVAREEYLGDGVDTEDRLIGQLKKLWGQAKRLFSMKKSLLIVVLLAESGLVSYAQSAQIKFDKLTHNFGMFSEKMPVVETEFSFTNTGDAPLVINQAAASCACTVPEYTKSPIQPGQKGTIKVIYNGTGKFPGRFRKSITIRTNGVPEMTRLYIEGEMVDGHILASARGVAIKAKPSTPHGKMIVFSAAQGDETAYPYHEQQHGMFTYYLLKKLKDTKGEVSLGELSDYITQRVKQQSIVENNKMQTPAVKASAALADSWRAMKLK